MPPFDIDASPIQLRCLIAVVEAGSFASAGKRLGMTTSGVSKTISRFEAARGVQLLHRSTHSVSLTQAGEVVVQAARRALLELDRFNDEITEVAQTTAGRVTITAPVAFIRRGLLPILSEFSAECPGIVLDLRASDEFVNLAEAAVDLALRMGSFDNLPGHSQSTWFDFNWVAAASPTYLSQRGIPATVDELDQHDLIAFRNNRSGLIEPWTFKVPRDGASDHRIRYVPTPSIVLDDAETAWSAVTQGLGIAFAPEWLAAQDIDTGRATEILRLSRGFSTRISIVRRARHLAPQSVEAVIAFLKKRAPRFRR